MTNSLIAACIQNCASIDASSTMHRAEEFIREAAAKGADLICTPEFFSCLDTQLSGLNTNPHNEKKHPALPHFQSLANELEIWLLLGSLTISGGGSDNRLFNRSYLIDSTGQIIARYNKIHLFDIDVDKKDVYRESNQFQPGNEAVLASTPWGRLGMTVCYDVRFPHLYRDLAKAGAGIITVPSAFTKKTGQAHWHVLLRARAIETATFVIAPCQSGTHGIGTTYGHSILIDPWGNILAEADEENEGVVIAELNLELIEKARRRIPALKHDREYQTP